MSPAIPPSVGVKADHQLSQDDSQRDMLIPMQERVAAVKPFWETLPQDARSKILTVSVTELKQKAAELAERQRKQAGKAALSLL